MRAQLPVISNQYIGYMRGTGGMGRLFWNTILSDFPTWFMVLDTWHTAYSLSKKFQEFQEVLLRILRPQLP